MTLEEIKTEEEQFNELKRAAERLRWHSLKITDEAESGHPTSCLSCADILSVLFFKYLKITTNQPHNRNNDRFILSKGHAAPILWAAYYECGLMDREGLHSLREIDSKQEGHPTPRNPWVDVATGSLGQGLPMGLGMSWGAKFYQTPSRTYVLMGDGETMEGSNWEAAALASYTRMNNLTAIVDINQYGQSQATMLGEDRETYRKRFEAFGWNVLEVNGHDLKAIDQAFEKAISVKDRPSVILALTIKGKGIPDLEADKGKHGKPAPSLKEALDCLDASAMNDEQKLSLHASEDGDDMASMDFNGKVDAGDYSTEDKTATREAFGNAILSLGKIKKNVVALDGDVKNSTKLKGFFDTFPNRSIECFIAEQNMVGMAIGLSKTGLVPCVATFAAFLTRAYDQFRMASISRSKLIVAGSHAGVAIGEDGPTQMGLEDIAMMRSLPDSMVLYPSDAVSTHAAIEDAARYSAITYIRLNRGSTPNIYKAGEEFHPGMAKIHNESKDDQLTLVGAGVTLHECLKAKSTLEKKGISVRVVDCYSIKPIDGESLRRCAEETKAVIVVEDHYSEGGIGEAVLAAIAGIDGKWKHIAVKDLPRSGDPEALLDRYGLSDNHIVEAAQALLNAQ